MPSYSALTDRSAVHRAIEEFDDLGREAFLHKYGFGPAREYFLTTDTGTYDSKAIFGVAFGYQHGTPLSSDEFSGGRDGAAGRLAELGFSVTGINTQAPSARRIYQRVEVPDGISNPWEWALAMPYRCIADPRDGLVMPASPESLADGADTWDRRHRLQLAYYTTLQSFLTYSFGWTRHDKGLFWWYSSGCPTEDRRLALLKDIWLRDDTLIGYLAWVIARMESQPDDAMIALRPWTRDSDLRPIRVPDEWAVRFRAALSRGVWTGGYDPMHLWGGLHAGTPSGRSYFGESSLPPTHARIVDVDAGNRRATFIADHVDGWYAQLTAMGSTLPQLPHDASWRIDVFVKPIGFVGMYRRSRTTGLWFSGRHHHHAVGN